MKCKNLKIKLNHTLYCKRFNEEIQLKNCNNCKYKEYEIKYKSIVQKNNKNRTIKNKTKKLAKLENNRFSIIYKDLTKCCVPNCECNANIQKNEVFEGAYRLRSIKNGMITPFCDYHHKIFHNDILFNLKYKVMFQKEFMKTHTLEEFISEFGQNYIFKYQKITNSFQQK